MKKISLLMLLMLVFSVSPVWAGGEEIQASNANFSFSIDPVTGPDQVEYNIVLKNIGNSPLSFEFPTSQKYEITVLDANGKKVYQYSEGRSFTQAFEKLGMKPMESTGWKESWDYRLEGTRVKEGEYTVIAELKATSLNGKAIAQTMKTDQKTMYVPGENPVFRAVKVEGSKGHYSVTGEARPMSGKFFYTVEDGHNELIRETLVSTGSKYPEWSNFEMHVSIPEEKLPRNGSLILNLYERSKDGSIIHTYPVVLERFNFN